MAENEERDEHAEKVDPPLEDDKLRGSDYVNSDGIVVRVRNAKGQPI